MSRSAIIGMVVLHGVLLFAATMARAQPDLVVDATIVSPTLAYRYYASDDCSVVEGCTSAGQRRLLVFNTETRNDGTADLVLGDPVGNPLFEFFPCHGHYHLKDYMSYRLRDTSSAQVMAGYKQSFCLGDTIRVDSSATTTPLYDCSYQGIQAGWADVYLSNLPCQWVDVTNVPPGDYILEMEVNRERLLIESNYLNNITTVPVTIPPLTTPPNDDCVSATLLVDGTTTGSTASATGDGSSTCGGVAVTNDVWYRYVAAASGMGHFSLCDSSFDTVLSIHTGCPGTLGNTLQCNDDSSGPDCPGSKASEITMPLTQGVEYYLRVSGFQGASGTFTLSVAGPDPNAAVTSWNEY